MKKVLFILSLLSIAISSEGKKYPFDMNHQYNVQQIRVAQDESRFLKSWGVAGNVKKAIDRALQDAVACCIFQGIGAVQSTTGHNASGVPALCPNGVADYEAHKDYFDNFFKNGEFMLYVENANTRYPTGENNVSISGGRKVGIYVLLKVKQLRKRLEKDGIIQSFDDIWNINK